MLRASGQGEGAVAGAGLWCCYVADTLGFKPGISPVMSGYCRLPAWGSLRGGGDGGTPFTQHAVAIAIQIAAQVRRIEVSN